MDLPELRAIRWDWTIESRHGELICSGGAFRFRAADPDDAEEEMTKRAGPPKPRPEAEPPEPGTVGELMGELAEPGF